MTVQLGFEFFEVESKQEALRLTKVCKSCKKEKPLEEYYTSQNTDGRLTRCKECHKEDQRWRQAQRKLLSHTVPEVCDCCGKPPNDVGKGVGITKLSLDHDHITREFRGWLCQHCNQGIGKLGDDLEGVLKAVAYLKRHYEKD